jgi:hypothetical protein
VISYDLIHKLQTFETNFVQRKDGSILGTLIPKYVYKPWGATFSAEINTKKEVKAEVSVADKITPGLKTTLTANSRVSYCTRFFMHE